MAQEEIGAATAAVGTLDEELPEKQIHLVRSTYRLIGSKGMHRMTLQDVADEADVSKAVIVYYFKTKENLVLKTMAWVLGRVAARIAAAVEREDRPEDKVRAMVDAIFVDAVRNRNFYLAYTDLIASAARHDRFNALSATFRSIMNGVYADVIRSGRDGTFRVDDVDRAAMVVRAVIDGLFLQWLEEEDWQGRHGDYRELCAAAVLRSLAGRG